jgi:Asp-tRNA(Asn)/Glu-tRNA(Gln) amidotransferase A subunit family amidase
VALVRRAGWLHDIGRAAITSRIWDKPGPLTAAEWEQARMHPYFTRRVLGQVAGWTELAEVAGAHPGRQAGIAADVERLGIAAADLEPRTAQLARKGRTVLRRGGPDRRVAAGWRDTMVRWLTQTATDVVLLPATAGDPLPAGSMIGKGYLRTLMVVGAGIPLTQAWNLSGLPALVVPVGVGDRTVGIQLVGRPGGESTLLSVAATLEAAR